MKQKLRVAILGAGNIARAMAAALRELQDEVICAAVGSRSLQKAEDFAQSYGFARAYGSYEELARDPQVDLVYVATPHSEHYANTRLCLEHGKHCLVEKAFCANAAQAAELLTMAKARGLLLAEAMWTRYQPSKEVIRSLLAEGAIGKVQTLTAIFTMPLTDVPRLVEPSLAGGALLDLGIYALTVPAMYFGSDIVRVEPQITKYHTGVDATTEAVLHYMDGRTATVKCSFVEAAQNRAELAGDGGKLVFFPINCPTTVQLYDKAGRLVREIDTAPGFNGYEYEVQECCAMIRAGATECPSLPHREILRMMRWMDALRASAGIVYPFETAADCRHTDEEVWGRAGVLQKS